MTQLANFSVYKNEEHLLKQYLERNKVHVFPTTTLSMNVTDAFLQHCTVTTSIPTALKTYQNTDVDAIFNPWRQVTVIMDGA